MKIGIVGTNFVSDWFVQAARNVEGAEVAAIYSRGSETGAEFARRHGIPLAFSDYGRMLESDIDAVYIASPTFAHEEQALRAISAGKHVLCEKMLAASYPAAKRMAERARARGVVLLEAMRPDFDPATRVIEQAIASVGKIRRAHLEYCQYSSRYDKFKAGIYTNAFDPHICNSALADIGIYPLHLALRFFGKPEAVRSSSVFLNGGFEGMGQITMEYTDMLCQVVYSKITDSRTPSVIEGERGSLIFDRVHAPNEIILALRGEAEQRLPFTRVENNMSFEIEAFRDMVIGRMDGKPYLDLTLESVRIANESYVQTGAIKYMDYAYMV